MKWRKCGTCITKQNCSYFCNKCRCTGCFCKNNPVIAWIWFRECRKFSTCFPVKFSTVNNHTSYGCPMSSDKFGGRMNHNICSIFNRSYQIRGGKCIINHKRYFMSMRNLCYFFNIYYIRVWISKRLYKYGFCILLNGLFHFMIVKRVNKSSCYSISRQRMRKKIIGSAINILC